MTSRHSWARHFLKAVVADDRCVVDEDIEPTALLLEAAEHALDLVVVSDVTLLGESLAAGRFDFLKDVRGEVGRVMVVDDRRRAGVGELLGDCGSETARTAGNEGDASQQGL